MIDKQISRDKSTSSESSPIVNTITTIPQVSHISSPRSIHSKISDKHSSIVDFEPNPAATVLVWKDLVVSTKEKKKNPFLFFQNTEPTSKRLLHSVSGVITGGLWAVMGELILQIKAIVYLKII